MQLTLSKRILFYIIWFTLPVLFLILVEVTLRYTWIPDEEAIVNEVQYDNIDWYEINRAYLQKFFPYNIVYFPEFKPVPFRKDKPQNLYRVICLGGSSMYGTPYLITANITGIIRRQLRHLYPDKEFEVINFAATAINSNVIRRFIHELEQFDPDLILIYMGHNEFYGPDGVGASVLEKAIPFTTDLKYAFRRTRIGTWLRNKLRAFSRDSDNGVEVNLMREVSAESHIQLNSDDAKRVMDNFADNLAYILDFFAEQVMDNFADNLAYILDFFAEQQIPVIVSDVSSNLDFPPFAYPRISGGMDIDLLRQSYSVSDLTKIKALLERHPDNAMLHYLIGQLYIQMNNPDAARKHFEQARDHDLLKFRAPHQINNLIGTVCIEKKVPYISADNFISRKSPMGITGNDLFWEHLHLNARGYAHIAELFLSKINELNLIGSTINNPLPANPDSLYLCWLDLAYADLGIKKLTSGWPFSDYPMEPAVISKSAAAQVDIARAVHQRQIAWMEGCYRSAAMFERFGQFNPARITYKAILEEFPTNYYAHYLLAKLYKDNGRLGQAVHHYKRSLQFNAGFLQSNLELGLIENNLGRFDDAITHFNRALQLVPTDAPKTLQANIYYGLSAAYANTGDTEAGLQYARQALQQDPNYRPAQQLLQQIQQNRSDEIR
jgi:tetratricopeptide (TPR) repeat protein